MHLHLFIKFGVGRQELFPGRGKSGFPAARSAARFVDQLDAEIFLRLLEAPPGFSIANL